MVVEESFIFLKFVFIFEDYIWSCKNLRVIMYGRDVSGFGILFLEFGFLFFIYYLWKMCEVCFVLFFFLL